MGLLFVARKQVKKQQEEEKKELEKIKQVKILKQYKITPAGIVFCIILGCFTLGLGFLLLLWVICFENTKYDFLIIYKDDTREIKKAVSNKREVENLMLYL